MISVANQKPKPPPKPPRLSSGRISQLIQRRQEELAAAKILTDERSATALSASPVLPSKAPLITQQRPKIRPPPSPSLDSSTSETTKSTTSGSFKTRKRVIRKPSSRPPPPPASLKPSRSDVRIYQCISDESEDELRGQSFNREAPQRGPIRARLADGTEIPRLPTIAPPAPPISHETEEEVGGLYEEIEYEFTVKATTGSAQSRFDDYKYNINDRPSNRFPSHPNLGPQDSNEYAEAELEGPFEQRGTQTLGRASAHAIAAAFKSGVGARSLFGRPTNTNSNSLMSSSMVASQLDVWNERKSTVTNNRPISSLDFVKIDRLTNGFQQITRQVDKLKRRRFAGARSQDSAACERTHLSDRETPISSLDSRIYGDDWSSEEEAEESGKVDEDHQLNNDPLKYEFAVHESTADSLLAEIESAYRGICESSPIAESNMTDQQKTSSNDATKLDPRHSAAVTMRSSGSQDLDSGSLCSSSFLDADEAAEMATKKLVDELKAVALPDELDTESMSDAERKSAYESELAAQQPLYQIYMLEEQQTLVEDGTTLLKSTDGVVLNPATTTEENEADSVCDSASDDLASVTIRRRQSSSASTDSGRGGDSVSRVTSNTSMRRDRLTAASAYGSQRSLWCELPAIKQSNVLSTMDVQSQKLQESYFEVITSEASYLRSINVLMSHFMTAPELRGPKTAESVITAQERKHLFSNIGAIRDCAERLLCDLEGRLKDNLVLTDLCDILCDHLDSKFDAYIKYCSNQVYQDRTLKRLKSTNSQFLSCINRIESHRDCQGLDMRSFLILPMQRACRYPLLVYAILDRVHPGSKQHDTASRALNLANQLVRACNEGARRMERVEQLLEIERRLVYKSPELKRLPLVNDRRYVVKSGQLMQLVEKRMKPKLSMLQGKQRLRPLHLFLFNDILMLAEKKLNGTFICKDYAQRRYVEVEPLEAHSHKIPPGLISLLPSKPHLFLLVLMQNARMKHLELLLNADSESDRERWTSVMRRPICSNPDETIYACWDSPLCVTCNDYCGSQEDELPLVAGDLVNILRKTSDGWYFGERVKDGRQGWFPSSFTQLVVNDHVRANAYRNRYRLMQKASEEFQLQQQGFDDKRVSSISIGTPTRNRLRRLSNPKAFFAT